MARHKDTLTVKTADGVTYTLRAQRLRKTEYDQITDAIREASEGDGADLFPMSVDVLAEHGITITVDDPDDGASEFDVKGSTRADLDEWVDDHIPYLVPIAMVRAMREAKVGKLAARSESQDSSAP